MDRIGLSDLTRILRECAGEEEGVDLDGDVLDLNWMELGYDSSPSCRPSATSSGSTGYSSTRRRWTRPTPRGCS